MVESTPLSISDEFIERLIKGEYVVTLHDLSIFHESEEILANFKTAWEEIHILSVMKFNNAHGEVTICADWTKAAEKVLNAIQRYSIDINDTDELKQYNNEDELKQYRDTDIIITASSNYKNDDNIIQIRRTHAHYVELYLHNVFLAMNLSTPGSLKLWGAKFSVTEFDNYGKTIQLSEGVFGRSWKKSILLNWPPISRIPLLDVNNWLQSFNMNTHQFSTSRTERVLFALLHLSNSDDPFSTIMWATYIVETLYDTPFTAIKKMLTDRISLVLGTPTNKTRKMIGEFYDLRSSFLHGRMEIPHPMENELLDTNAQNHWEILNLHNDLACSIIISTLQYHIRNKYNQLKFNEGFEGIPSTT